MIAIIDYGMGNLRSVQKAFAAVGHDAVVTREPALLAKASRLVLPGVGAFPDCMANLEQYNLIEPIRNGIASGKPFLGICLGLQVLFTESEEFGSHQGLDIVHGKVRRFRVDQRSATPTSCEPTALKVPHMGWNELTVKRAAPPLQNLPPRAHVYFVHSYYVEPLDSSVIATTTHYGTRFVSSIWRENIFACQFHPEKSQTVGLQIVKHFAEWR